MRIFSKVEYLYFIWTVLNGLIHKGYGWKLNRNAADWALNIVNDDGIFSKLDDIERGFNLTKEEIKKIHIWPSGIIPYLVDPWSFDKVMTDRIRLFLENINTLTGLHFIELIKTPRDHTARFVLFLNRRGQLQCSDYPFWNFSSEGIQKIVLGYNCLGSGRSLAAIILSLVGVPPQHNSPNRDDYITVNMDNILPDKVDFFTKLKNDEWLFHDVPYDYNSAGHYNMHKYTANGSATIVMRVNVNVLTVGENKGFSYTDIWKIRMLYNFIVTRRSSKNKISGCKKLFSGSNFINSAVDSGLDLEPRKKPFKYLNMADKEPSVNQYVDDNNDGNTETDKNKLAVDETVMNENDRTDVKDSTDLKDSTDVKDSKKVTSNFNRNKSRKEKNGKLSLIRKTTMVSENNSKLFTLSDYNSEDKSG